MQTNPVLLAIWCFIPLLLGNTGALIHFTAACSVLNSIYRSDQYYLFLAGAWESTGGVLLMDWEHGTTFIVMWMVESILIVLLKAVKLCAAC